MTCWTAWETAWASLIAPACWARVAAATAGVSLASAACAPVSVEVSVPTFCCAVVHAGEVGVTHAVVSAVRSVASRDVAVVTASWSEVTWVRAAATAAASEVACCVCDLRAKDSEVLAAVTCWADTASCVEAAVLEQGQRGLCGGGLGLGRGEQLLVAVSSTVARSCPARTVCPTLTSSEVTTPPVTNDRPRVEGEVRVPEAETVDSTVPRWTRAVRWVVAALEEEAPRLV